MFSANDSSKGGGELGLQNDIKGPQKSVSFTSLNALYIKSSADNIQIQVHYTDLMHPILHIILKV